MKRLTFFLAASFVLTGLAYGQTELPKQISGGVLNGKAVKLPKPAYPAAARAVNAEGAVSVQVLIDEAGRVISASAVSGHPLLRVAATEAAQQAEFSPTLLQGNPVKVSGIITYNFVGAMTPGMFGYEIAYASRAGVFGEYTIARSLAARLPESMTAEREALESLTYEAPKAPHAPPPAPATTKDNANKFTVKGSASSAYVQQKLTPESVDRLRTLEAEVESRLSSNADALWNYRLGKSLGAFVAEIGDEVRFRANLAELENLAAGTPQSAVASEKLNAFIERARTGADNPEAREELIRAAKELSKIRTSRW